MKTITLPDFLTETQIKNAASWYQTDRLHFHQRVLDDIITPNMAKINKALGQENSPEYLAYVVEYACMQAAEVSK